MIELPWRTSGGTRCPQRVDRCGVVACFRTWGSARPTAARAIAIVFGAATDAKQRTGFPIDPPCAPSSNTRGAGALCDL